MRAISPPSAAEGADISTPGAGGRPRRWYKRRAVLVTLGVLIVIAVTVVTDLPQNQSRSSQVAEATTVVNEVNADIGPCSYALGESFTIYSDLQANSLSKGERGQVPGLLRDDQAACSFTDDSIFQLSTIDVPGGQFGRLLGQMLATVTLWATSDSLSAIEQIQTLSSSPANAAALRRLASDEVLLAKDRAQSISELSSVRSLLGNAHLPALQLTTGPKSPAR